MGSRLLTIYLDDFYSCQRHYTQHFHDTSFCSDEIVEIMNVLEKFLVVHGGRARHIQSMLVIDEHNS